MNTMNEQITKTKETKNGLATTEFWVSAIATSGAFISALAGALPPEKAAYVTAAISGFYAIARGLAKQG